MYRILYLLIICTLFSCDVINPEEQIPAYIEIGSFNLLSTPNSGSNNQNITEGWVYVDNILIGAFAKGKPFPVLAEGTQEILVDPGILENGISFTPSLYPYYTRYMTTAELIPGQTTVINPEFEYREETEFKFIQEFDNNTIFTVDRDENEETRIRYTSEGALEGVSAIIELNQENPTVDISTNLVFDLPVLGVNDTWLEVSFKTDVPIAIGLLNQDDFGRTIPLYGHGLNTTDVWKKVYINLKEIIINNPVPPYQVGFGAELPLNQANATIMLDNIKLLHFKE